MARPKRTFQANVGQPSVGSAGPDQIEYDLDNLFAMFDPSDKLRDDTQGGITKDNVRSGIATLDANGRVEQDSAYSSGVTGFTPASVKAALDALARGETSPTARVAFRAYQSTAQSLAAATWTKVAFQAEVYDQGKVYDVANYRFVAPAAGIYLVSAVVHWGIGASGESHLLSLYVNGFDHSRLGDATIASAADHALGGCVPLRLNAGDYVEVFAISSNARSILAGSSLTYFTAVRIA